MFILQLHASQSRPVPSSTDNMLTNQDQFPARLIPCLPCSLCTINSQWVMPDQNYPYKPIQLLDDWLYANNTLFALATQFPIFDLYCSVLLVTHRVSCFFQAYRAFYVAAQTSCLLNTPCRFHRMMLCQSGRQQLICWASTSAAGKTWRSPTLMYWPQQCVTLVPACASVQSTSCGRHVSSSLASPKLLRPVSIS